MPNKEPTIALYPKIGLRAFVAMTSELMPNAGKQRCKPQGDPRTRTGAGIRLGLPPVTSNASPPMKDVRQVERCSHGPIHQAITQPLKPKRGNSKHLESL